VRDVKEVFQFYEMLLYSMSARSRIFGTEIMKYHEKQLYNIFRNEIISHPYIELSTNLLGKLDFSQDF
jgi:hypothetical protein